MFAFFSPLAWETVQGNATVSRDPVFGTQAQKIVCGFLGFFLGFPVGRVPIRCDLKNEFGLDRPQAALSVSKCIFYLPQLLRSNQAFFDPLAFFAPKLYEWSHFSPPRPRYAMVAPDPRHTDTTTRNNCGPSFSFSSLFSILSAATQTPVWRGLPSRPLTLCTEKVGAFGLVLWRGGGEDVLSPEVQKKEEGGGVSTPIRGGGYWPSSTPRSRIPGCRFWECQ